MNTWNPLQPLPPKPLRAMHHHVSKPAIAPWGFALVGGLCGVLLALIIWAPAQWLAWGVQKASHAQVQLRDTRGTIWSGSAQLVLTGGADSRDAQALPGRFEWSLTPHWTGLNLHWRADCCMVEAADVQVRTDGVTWQMHIGDHNAKWPARILTGLGAPWNTLQADGQMHVSTKRLQLSWTQGRLQVQGLAQLQMHNMSTRLSPIYPIGSYLLELNGTPEGTPTPGLVLTTLQGPLMLSGEGQWVGTRLRFSGQASAQEGHEPALSNLLNILGRRQGQRSLISLG